MCTHSESLNLGSDNTSIETRSSVPSHTSRNDSNGNNRTEIDSVLSDVSTGLSQFNLLKEEMKQQLELKNLEMEQLKQKILDLIAVGEYHLISSVLNSPSTKTILPSMSSPFDDAVEPASALVASSQSGQATEQHATPNPPLGNSEADTKKETGSIRPTRPLFRGFAALHHYELSCPLLHRDLASEPSAAPTHVPMRRMSLGDIYILNSCNGVSFGSEPEFRW